MILSQPHEGMLAYQQNQQIMDRAREDTLLRRYMGLVRNISRHMTALVNQSFSLEDMEQIGLMALLEVIRRHTEYDEGEIENIAKKRIRGAILDELRKQDWRSRLTRQRAHELKNVERSLARTLGRTPTERELSQEMGISLDEVHQRRLDHEAATLESFDVELNGQSLAALSDQSQSYDNEKLRKDLRLALEHLSQRDQLILTFYYEHEMSLKEIALAFELSEARICQLHSKAIQRLSAILANWKN